MLSYMQAIILGLLQGATELFPVSSLGHTVVFPYIFGWHINQSSSSFLTFLVATHTATALILFMFFIDDWKKIFSGLVHSLQEREVKETDYYAKLGWLLIITTIPAGIVGVLFEQTFTNLFANPRLVACTLLLNGLVLFCAELLRKKNKEQTSKGSDVRIAKLRWIQALKIGVIQCIAFIPGFSRTGATLTGGLLEGLSHEDAARFSFLLATPIIGGASLLKLPDLMTKGGNGMVGQTVIGALAAGIGAFFSVRFLTKYFEKKNLTPFGIYCVAIGLLLSLVFFFH